MAAINMWQSPLVLLPKLAATMLSLLHVYILYLEMFLWTTPKGRRAFGLKSAEFARQTRVLAANQAFYNGILAAGLAWGAAHPDPLVARQIRLFFASAVAAAGVFGGLTASRRIFVVQALPGFVGVLVELALW